MSSHHLPPAKVRPLDRIPALGIDRSYIVGEVELIDEPHPFTRRAPHWRITDLAGERPHHYDDNHRCVVHREESRR